MHLSIGMTLVGKKGKERIGQEQEGQGKTRQVKEWADSKEAEFSAWIHIDMAEEGVLIGIVRILFGAWSLACLGSKRTWKKGMTTMDHTDTIDTLRG